MFNNSFSDTFNSISQKFNFHILIPPLFKYNAIIVFSCKKFLSNFALKIYDDNSNANSSEILNENFIHNIINKALETYFSLKHQLLKNSRFNLI